MLDFPKGVVFPSSLTSVSEELGWVQYFAIDLMLLSRHFDIELSEFSCIQELVDDVDDALHPLLGVRNLELLKIFHFPRIRCKVLGERSITAHFCGQVDSSVPEIHEQKGLFGVSEVDLILLSQVVLHANFKFLSVFFHLEGIGAGIQVPFETIDLVRLNIISRNYRFPRLVLV